MLALPPVDLTEGQVAALWAMVDEWGSSAELGAIEAGRAEAVRNRYVAQAVRQDLRRPSVNLAPLLAELHTSTDARASAIAFYSGLGSPGRYVRGLHDLATYWREWWRTDDPTYRANLEAVSRLVAEVVGRRDIRDLAQRGTMSA